MNNQEWEEIREYAIDAYGEEGPYDELRIEALKSFIQLKIDKARKEERENTIKVIAKTLCESNEEHIGIILNLIKSKLTYEQD